MKKLMLLCLIFLQIFLIIMLIINIQNKKKDALKLVSVNPQSKNSLIFPSFDNLKYFYEHKPDSSLKMTISGISSTNTINGDTLVERFNYSMKKPDKAYRIVTLGDSFTSGAFVDTKDNWTELLENELNINLKCENINKFEVINLAVGGYDALYEVKRYKKRGIKYDADLILWYLTDPLRIDEEYNGILDVKADKDTIYRLFQQARLSVLKKYGEKALLVYQSNAISALRKYFSGPVVVVAKPNMSQKEKDFIKTQAQKNGYIYYGNSRDYYTMKGSFSPADLHPNKKGHEIISEDLFKYLNENKLTPCN